MKTNYKNEVLQFEDYNGWTNRDTWLIPLWVENEYSSYMRKEEQKEKTKNMTNKQLIEWLKSFYYGDKVNFNKVCIEDIKEWLSE
jgi:hypothetical protein